MPKTTATRYHDISVGHRVVGHECKCRFLHGHNYRVHFTVQAKQIDDIGRVLDFSAIKEKLCVWLEDNWDHRFLAWEKDSLLRKLAPVCLDSLEITPFDVTILSESFVFLPFNPTAENLAKHLVQIIGPRQLQGTGTKLISVTIDETRKCSATYSEKMK